MRILLVEDDSMNARFFVDVFDGTGHTIVVETTGLAGYARALQESFDLIALDIQLPGLRGDMLCRELREQGVRTPIVALSADAIPAEVETALAAGFDRYLTKPFSPAALRAMVAGYAGTSGPRHGA